MRRVKIITDSTADLPNNLIKEYDIDIVPLHIILGDKSFLDDGSYKAQDLFAYADKNNVLPKSAAANEYQFTKAFKKWLDEDYDIFFIGISGKLSATVQNAMTALEQLDKERISVFDSLSLSTGIGLQVLEASELARSGGSLKEISEKAQSVRAKVQASFVVDTLKYLYMGGRCSKLASIMGSSLSIKPKLVLKGGEIVLADKLRGSGAIKKYCSQLMEESDRIDRKRVFVTHCLSDKADEMKQILENEHGFKNVYITDASSVISAHCGPGTLGILYLYK